MPGFNSYIVEHARTWRIARLRSLDLGRVGAAMLSALALWSCARGIPASRHQCPTPPAPECRPRLWQGHALDTAQRTDRPFPRIRALRGAALPELDELALSLHSDHRGWLTRSDGARQWVEEVSLPELDSLVLERPLEAPFADFGMPSGKAAEFFLAARSPDAPPSEVRLIRARLRKATVEVLEELSPDTLPAWESQPALSADGTVLFFAADYPDGLGGTDLYFRVRRPDGSWSPPINCGPPLNTPCNELTPALSRDGRWLLFASNGHESLGGYDLFAVAVHPAFWEWLRAGMPTLPSDTRLLQPWFGQVENLGAPINTAADELAPFAPGQPDSLLYWSSNRAGSFDMYVLYRVEPLATPLEPAPTIELRGTVRERETQRPIPYAEVRAHRIGEPTPVARTLTDTGGAYRLRVPARSELELIAQAGEVFFEVQRLRTGIRDTALGLEVPARLFLRLNFPTDRYDQPYPFVLDSNGNETPLRWEQMLDLLAENLLRYRDRIRAVTLVGHTDDVASAEYNLWLGQKRVEFVVEELRRRGVPVELLQAESAGESQLLPRRRGEPLEQWRRRCRRVELSKVLQAP
mgnify:CR=1 FL=1